MEQKNGNTQVNTEREEHNKRVSRLTNIGRSKHVIWNNKRRFRSI